MDRYIDRYRTKESGREEEKQTYRIRRSSIGTLEVAEAYAGRAPVQLLNLANIALLGKSRRVRCLFKSSDSQPMFGSAGCLGFLFRGMDAEGNTPISLVRP